MTEQYCRIDLSCTNYKEIHHRKLTTNDYNRSLEIYHEYCIHKNFDPFHYHPLWIDQFNDDSVDVLGYYDQDELVAFSMIYLFPTSLCCYADQFAWDYKNPKLRLGYKSIRSECARYKRMGYQYYYLGEVTNYKQQLQGFELVKRPSRNDNEKATV